MFVNLWLPVNQFISVTLQQRRAEWLYQPFCSPFLFSRNSSVAHDMIKLPSNHLELKLLAELTEEMRMADNGAPYGLNFVRRPVTQGFVSLHHRRFIYPPLSGRWALVRFQFPLDAWLFRVLRSRLVSPDRRLGRKL